MNVKERIRPLLNRLGRGVSFRRRLPAQTGGDRIYITPEAGPRYWISGPGASDFSLQSCLLEFVKPGASFWDVGANLGWVSIAAAALTGGVSVLKGATRL